jgi:DNA-binding HxlR family transcriptional regulator
VDTKSLHEPAENPDGETKTPEAVAALDALDDTIHQKVRLGIMSTLLAMGEADFKLLKETLALSDGNLSTHLALLEERGYVAARKEFVRRKPHTTYTPTEGGREAFHRYLRALERIIRASSPDVQADAERSSQRSLNPQRAGN